MSRFMTLLNGFVTACEASYDFDAALLDELAILWRNLARVGNFLRKGDARQKDYR